MKDKHILHFIQRVPIRWRLTFVSFGLLILLLSVLGIILSVVAEQVLVNNEVDVLRNEAQVAWKGTFKSMESQDRLFGLDLDNVYPPAGPVPTNFVFTANPLLHSIDNAATNTYAILLTPDGRSLIPNSPYIAPEQVQHIMQSDQWYLLTNDVHGHRQLLVFIPLISSFHTVGLLQISTSTIPIDNFLSAFHLTLLFGIIGTLGLAFVLTFPLVGLALHPLVEIERTSRKIAQGKLSMRIDPPETDDEIGRLARSFNRMVAQLEAAFRRQKRFVADVSHELRTPLTALSGSLEMLLIGADQGDKEATRRLTRGMFTEVQRMHRMVEDLLALTRLDEGKLTLRKEIIAIDTLLHTVYEQAEHLAHGQLLSCRIEPFLSTICADKDRLQQVLLNIMDNALKFTPPEGKVELLARKTDYDTVALLIRDTGQGIPPASLPHIFDRFYRADPSRSRSAQYAGGSGLGLAIAKDLVEAQGGQIEISSLLGLGTTVTITFPACNQSQRSKRQIEKLELQESDDFKA